MRFFRPNKNEWYATRPVAHRGLHQGRNLPENTLAAFKAAMEKNHPVEFDVRRLKDGTLIVFHDDNGLRLTDHDCEIDQMDFSTIKDWKILDSKETIPTFKSVLKLIDGKVPMLIELKKDGDSGREMVRAVLEELKDYKGEYALQSFNHYQMLWAFRYAPHVKRGLVSGCLDDMVMSLPQKLILKHMLLTLPAMPDFVAYEWEKLDLAGISLVRSLSPIPILAWTIKSKQSLSLCQQQCDNIIFEGFDPKN